MSMLRTIKPKNARVKRALEKREPLAVENEKTAIFVRGQSTSENVRLAMKDLYALKRPAAINFSRKNDIHPFDSPASLEFWASKNDASLFLTGLHSKKRPNDLIFSRMFDGRVLDMLEVGVESIRAMTDFETPKSAVGARPIVTFHSDLFDTHPSYQLFKSLLLDFYGGHPVPEIATDALELVISFTAGPLPTSSSTSADPSLSSSSTALPPIHMRVYTLRLSTTSSSSRTPKLNLTEMGPSIDFSLRRLQTADEDMWKHATRRPKIAKKDVESGLGKKRKNIETDAMGDRVGKIHLGKQDLGKLQGRKMKALKVGRRERADGAASAGEEAEADE